MSWVGRNVWVLVVAGTVACATIDYHFDPGAAPQWTRGGNSQSGDELRAVGLSPVTQDVARDRQRALNDAKSKLGQVVNSRVESVHRDFVAAGNMGENGKVASVQVQTVKVESMVDLGEVRTLSSFRDEVTRTHYIEVGIDRLKWMSRVEGNLEQHLKGLQELNRRAEKSKANGRILELLKVLRKSDIVVEKAKTDSMIARALGTSVNWSTEISQPIGNLEKLSKYLAEEVVVEIQCKEPAKMRACSTFEQGAMSFFRTLKIGGSGEGSTKLLVEVSLSSRKEGTQAVGKSIEYLASSGYTLRVRRSDGSTLRSLEVERLLGERNVRSGSQLAALTQAIEVAGEDALSNLRSRIRKELK